MERGRDGRRGVIGPGPVSAPRRPRTSGFKDNPVAEDGEDVMDDVHNPRLRERPKKDSTGSAAQLMMSGSLGSSSRNKRKRQGLQELQGQVRSSIVDEVDEATQDIEVGASEDDDDPPPPPIPRRPGKQRPQGKFVDDGIPADLPTVPRKARTAILKRPQESSSPPVGDSSHQGLPLNPRSPAPMSAPSSSSDLCLKPGRRMKSSGLKLRAVKASKVSTPTVISEQEVEVAEALFDLARMFTNQSNSSNMDVIIDMNPEPKEESKLKVEFEVESEANGLVKSIVACPQHAFPFSRPLSGSGASSSPILPQSSPIALGTSPNVLLSRVVSSAIVPAVVTVPVAPRTATSLSQVTAAPAEAPKRKRPRLRTRPDLIGCVSEVGLCAINGDVSRSRGLTVQSRGLEAVPILTSGPPNTSSSSLNVEASCLPLKSTSIIVSASPSLIISSDSQSLGLNSPARMPGSQLLEKKFIAVDSVRKVDGSTTPSPLHSLSSVTRDKKPAVDSVTSPSASFSLMDQASKRMPGCELVNVDLDESQSQQPVFTRAEVATVSGQPLKFPFDLMALPVTKSLLSPRSERPLKISGNTTGDNLNKCLVTVQAGSSGQSLWTDLDKGRAGDEQPEHERQCEEGRKYETVGEEEKSIELGLKRERAPVGHREGDSERLFQRDGGVSKEMVSEDEQRREDPAKQAHQRQGKAQKLEPGAQRLQRTALSTAKSAAVPSFSPSAAFVSNVATGVASFPVSSAGISNWPLGIPSVAYHSSSAAPAAWSSGSLLGGDADESAPPTVQLPNPYSIQARQLQPWKRCPSHVQIAHFIDLQQQMNRHPFMHAAFQSSGSLFGAKPYNLNIPLPPAESLFSNGSGGPLLSCVSGVAKVNVIGGDGSGSGLGIFPSSERDLGVSSLVTIAESKDRAYGEAFCKKQPSANLPSQSCPGFGFQVTQASTGAVDCLAAVAPAGCGGPVANPVSGSGSPAVGGSSPSPTGSNTGTGPGTSNGGVVSHAVAQAQYLQAVMQQGGFPFPFQAAAHFGPSFNGTAGHMGPPQATQFFGGPFYTSHLVPPLTHTQQQVQLGTNVSAGLPSVQKQQQHALQQVARNLSSASQQQSTSAPVTESPSQSQQQHPQGTASQQIHLTERDGSNIGDSNSSSDNNCPILERNIYGQGNPNGTVPAVNSSSASALGGGSQILSPQDFNLLSALGVTPQQGVLASQQHHGGGPSVYTSFKVIDQQSPQTLSVMSIASMSRGTVVGPGPLGLAPVAAVMAPEGHAMLHSVADPCRGPIQHQQPQNQQSVTAHSHQHSLQLIQQRGALQVQKTPPAIVSVEDGRTLDANTFPSRTGREPTEDRKLPSKRAMSSNLPKVDPENSSTVQGVSSSSAILHSKVTRSGSPTLNLLTAAPSILRSCPVGHPPGSGLQQPGTTFQGNQTSKQALPRGKLLTGLSGGGALVSSTQSQVSFSDRPPPGTLLPSKIQGTSSSSSGQHIPLSTQLPRQSPIGQNTQLKLSNRSTLNSLSTPSGTAPQAVLAAAIAKSQQVPQQHQSRAQVLAGTNTGPLPSPRLLPGDCAGTYTSICLPLPPLPPISKSVPASASKNNLTSKSSFTLPHKASSAVSSKWATPPIVSPASSLLGPSPPVQNLPLKSGQIQHPQIPPQQSHHNISQYHTHASNLPQLSIQSSQPSQSSVSTQYHQQAHLSSQQQLHQVHNKQTLVQQQQTHQMHRVFLQNPTFQPFQQSSGSSSNPLSQQQSSLQVVHQTTLPSLQPQQRASSPQQQQHHNLQGGEGSSSGTSSNGSLSLGPHTLTLGTGSNVNASPAAGSDILATSLGPVLRSNPTSIKVISLPATAQSCSRSNTEGPSFLQAQFVTSLSSGLQLSGSPRNISGAQYLQAIPNSESNSNPPDQKVVTDARNPLNAVPLCTDGNGQEHVNGIRSMSSPSLMPHSNSPSMQPSLPHQLTGGCLIGKPAGVQFSESSYSASIGSRSGFTPSVAPSLSSSNVTQSMTKILENDSRVGLDSSVQLGVDGRSSLGGAASVANTGAVSTHGVPSSGRQSLHFIASGPATSNSQTIGQSSPSVLQP